MADDRTGGLDDVATLRARLREAEATLAAIRAGDVDALVVEGPRGPRVFGVRGGEAPYRLFVQQMGEGAATLAGDGCILFANRGLGSLLQVSHDVLPGRRLDSFAVYEDAGRLRRLLARGEGRAECHLRRADGTLARALVSARPMAVDGKPVVCAVIADLSPHDVAETARRERDDAERANRAKDEFLATLSHELRTPLTAIVGWVRILELSAGNPARVAQAVQTLTRNTRALAAMIDDLLDVSRIVAGKLELVREPLDLAGLVRDGVESHRPAADTAGVGLVFAPCPAPLAVLGDPARLRQVIANVVGNALKFTPRGGHVDVACGRHGADAVVTVRDSGVGIDPTFVPRLFERFSQADGSSTRRYGGLGLGLAIVHHLVTLHGGSIDATSDGSGTGATFTLRLPLAADAAMRAPDARPPRRLDGAVDVLLVDDSRDARDVLAMVLREAGATVRTAATVPEALRAVAARRPTVLISDISMPEQDGYALIRALRAQEARAQPRLAAIAMTGLAAVGDERRAVAAGFDHHVAKPVDVDRLVALVAQVGTPFAG